MKINTHIPVVPKVKKNWNQTSMYVFFNLGCMVHLLKELPVFANVKIKMGEEVI
jgi:hypothetical protein